MRGLCLGYVRAMFGLRLGYVWAMFGQCLAMFGYVWLCLTMFDYVLRAWELAPGQFCNGLAFELQVGLLE